MTGWTKRLLFIGILGEVLLLTSCHLLWPEWNETFHMAARYSGRISFAVFLTTFYIYIKGIPRPISEQPQLRAWILLFGVLHVIHLGLLAANVQLNEIELISHKLIGGGLAYLLIVIAPFVLHKAKRGFQVFYFVYVSIVMIMTYVGRIKGADPFWFHYVAMAIIALLVILLFIQLFRAKKPQ